MGQDHSSSPGEEVRCEDLTDEITTTYTNEGYTLAFVENVMHFDLSQAIPHAALPFELSYLSWTPEYMHDFFLVYNASFRERPGFPGWSEDEWLHWTSDDPGFRPSISVLAMVQGKVAGFVSNAEYEEPPGKDGYIIQLGVHPDWRKCGVGSALVIHTLEMWREASKESVILHVNVNNPGAIRLYRQLGFVTVRKRGKFTR